MTAQGDKLDRVIETVQRVDGAHHTTNQLLFSDNNDHVVAVREHGTPAQQLISLWPSVRCVLDSAQLEIHADYVAYAEDRPSLDPFARRPSSQTARGSSSLTTSIRSTPVPQGLSSHRADSGQRPHTNQSGSRADGGLDLDLDRNTLKTLFASYLLHMHILHPFLNKHTLRAMLDTFMEKFANDPTRANPESGSSLPHEPSRKRNRSQIHNDVDRNDTSTSFRLWRDPQQIENATICLVLALGKICMHQDHLPSVFDDAPDVETLFSQRDSRDEQSQYVSPWSVPLNSSTSTVVDYASTRANVSPPGTSEDPFEGPANFDSKQHERNLDAVPGLAYYTVASAMLGGQADGTTLAHAQLFALAGLYKAQLARVRESLSWISKAGRIVQLLIQAEWLSNAGPLPTLPMLRNSSSAHPDSIDAYRAAVRLTAWIVLPLESDILAELKFPSSGLPALEPVPYNIPDCSVTDTDLHGITENCYTHEMVVLFHSAQTFLHTRLDCALGEINGGWDSDRSAMKVQDILRSHESILDRWRNQLPDTLRWDNDDTPSPDILHARLRAKYWEVRYVITRPFLDFAMHIMPFIKRPADVGRFAVDAKGYTRELAEVRLLEAIAGVPKNEIWEAVRSCIDAAMQSTVAFDGITDRVIVTNIHGTAHAYVVRPAQQLLSFFTC